MGIDPTALIEPGAHVHATAEIGPFCVIGPRAMIGEHSKLLAYTVVSGRTHIGARNVIQPYSVIGGYPQDTTHQLDDSRVFIGDDNVIGAGVTINGGTTKGDLRTVVGHRNRIGTGAHVAHDCQVEDDCLLGTNCLLAGHVRVEHRSSLGDRSGVHHFATVGRLSVVSNSARVNQDIPPFMRVGMVSSEVRGVNCDGLREQRIPENAIEALSQAHRTLWRQGLSKTDALSAVERDLGHNTLVVELIAFMRMSARGRLGRGREASRVLPRSG